WPHRPRAAVHRGGPSPRCDPDRPRFTRGKSGQDRGRSAQVRNRRLWLIAGAAVAIEYALARRFVFRRWGSTREEAERSLPGDEIVERPRFVSTFAIAIDAWAADVWPWIAQFGQGRG